MSRTKSFSSMPVVVKKASFFYNGLHYQSWDSLIEAVYGDLIERRNKENLKKILSDYIKDYMVEEKTNFVITDSDLVKDLEEGSIEWILSLLKQFWLF